MKVALVSSVYPYPVNYGKRVVLSGFVRYFVEEYGAENLLYVLTQSQLPEGSTPAQAPCAVTLVGRPGAVEQAFNGLVYTLVSRRKSIQESVLYSPGVGQRIQTTLAAFRPDLVVYDSVRSGQYHPRSTPPNARPILYLEDLFSVRYRRMREFISGNGGELDVLGTFAGNIPGILRPLFGSPRLQKSLLRFEETLVERSEILQSRRFPQSLLLNSAEVNRLRSVAPEVNVALIRPLAAASDSPGPPNWKERQEFVFIGNLRYAPNQKSIELFIRQALPAVLTLVPDFRLRIIGSGAPPDLVQQVEACGASVSLEGFVPDLSEVLARARAVLMPLVFGTGIKLKALDALRFGLPMISTRWGVDGLEVAHGRECFVEDDISQFGKWIQLLCDDATVTNMAAAARRYYVENFDPATVRKVYGEFFGLPKSDLTTTRTAF